jgi:hypothetical protein
VSRGSTRTYETKLSTRPTYCTVQFRGLPKLELDNSVQSPVVIIRKTAPISLHSLNEIDL